MCEQVHLFANRISNMRSKMKTEEEEDKDEQIDLLRRVLGVLQHHDAVSGTSKQHVANDYAWRLHNASKSCQALVSNSYLKLLTTLKENVKQDSNLTFCNLLNISLCSATEGNSPHLQKSNGDNGVFVLLYNSLGWEQSSVWIRFPIFIPQKDGNASNEFQVILKDLRVKSREAENLPYQLNQIDNRTLGIPERKTLSHEANYELLFNPTLLAPFGFSLFYFAVNLTSSPPLTTLSSVPSENQFFISKKTALHVQYKEGDSTVQIVKQHLESGVFVKLNIELMYYEGAENGLQVSGAYVFQPKLNSSAKKFDFVTGKVINGPLVKEVHVTFSSWASLVLRLYHDGELEVEWTVGPLPSDRIGREVVIRYTLDGDNILYNKSGEFFTDSSGRRLIKRVRNQRVDWNLPIEYAEEHNVTGNYYPVVNRIMLKNILLHSSNSNDSHDKIQMALAVYTDRSQGGTSLKDGELELMLHRQTMLDDGFGVDEPLMETGVDMKGLIVRGVHRIRLDELQVIESEDRRTAQVMRRPIIPLFVPSNKQVFKEDIDGWSAIKKSLPNHLHLLSLQSWPLNKATAPQAKSQILVRFENIDESSELSRIDVIHLFTGITITDVKEMVITADQMRKDAVSRRLKWPTEPSSEQFTPHYETNSLAVVLKIPPGKIMTYILDYKIDKIKDCSRCQ
ncbi:unnamed protein product [Heterobilharzia americana]|nr:unnamed protein product [Heterobilharzia americana]